MPFYQLPSDPNRPARNAELSRTLAPQLLAQLNTQSATEELTFRNTQRDFAGCDN